ncbi:membrane protein insertase YidC [Candidatus Foliamicus sp.]
MERLRFPLWALVGAMLLFSWQAWNQDRAREQAQAPSTDIVSDTLPSAEDPELPALPPVAEEGAPEDTGLVPAPSAQAAPPLVRVHTDVMVVAISASGGDLVEAELLAYAQDKKNDAVKVRLLSAAQGSEYVLSTGLRAAEGRPEANHRERFSSPRSEYRLEDGAEELVVPLTWRSDGISVTKRYRFRRGKYSIGVEQTVRNDSGSDYGAAPYVLLRRVHQPLKRSMFNVDSYSFTGPVYYDGDSYDRMDPEDLAEEPLSETAVAGWVGSIEHHFVAAAIPEESEPYRYDGSFNGGAYRLSAIGPLTRVSPGGEHTHTAKLFVGPKLQEQMRETASGLVLSVDYGIFTVFAQPLFWLLETLYGLVGNWGWAIVMATLIIKTVLFPLTEASGRSMARMRKLQPRLKSLQERFKDDPQGRNRAMMELYKTEKVNPAAGCLPIFIQLPFFIAFYWVLVESVEIRQAPFLLWINDLSSRDPIFVLPALMGVAMFWQQRLNPKPPDPMQAKIMTAMPIIFTVFFMFFPSGLVLYWLTNSVFSTLQQWRINRRTEQASKGRAAR